METDKDVSAEDNGVPEAEEILLPLGYQARHHGVLKIGRETHAISMSLDVYRNNGTTKFNVKDIVYGVQYLDWSNFRQMVFAYARVGVVIDLSLTSDVFRKMWVRAFPSFPNVVGLDGVDVSRPSRAPSSSLAFSSA